MPKDLLFLFRKRGGDFYLETDIEVSKTSLAFIHRVSFALQPHFCSWLCSGLDLHFHCALKGVDNGFATQNGGIEINFLCGIKVIPPPLESGIGIDHKTDIEVTLRTSMWARFAMTPDPDLLTVGYSGGYGDPDIFTINGDGLFVGGCRIA